MPIVQNWLQPEGPLVVASIGLSSKEIALRKELNVEIPELVTIRALIDTGASFTAADPWVFKKLGIGPTGKMEMHSASTGDTACVIDEHDALLTIFHDRHSFYFDGIPIGATPLVTLGIDALIGRDILEACVFTYNGINQTITLAF